MCGAGEKTSRVVTSGLCLTIAQSGTVCEKIRKQWWVAAPNRQMRLRDGCGRLVQVALAATTVHLRHRSTFEWRSAVPNLWIPLTVLFL